MRKYACYYLHELTYMSISIYMYVCVCIAQQHIWHCTAAGPCAAGRQGGAVSWSASHRDWPWSSTSTWSSTEPNAWWPHGHFDSWSQMHVGHSLFLKIWLMVLLVICTLIIRIFSYACVSSYLVCILVIRSLVSHLVCISVKCILFIRYLFFYSLCSQ